MPSFWPSGQLAVRDGVPPLGTYVATLNPVRSESDHATPPAWSSIVAGGNSTLITEPTTFSLNSGPKVYFVQSSSLSSGALLLTMDHAPRHCSKPTDGDPTVLIRQGRVAWYSASNEVLGEHQGRFTLAPQIRTLGADPNVLLQPQDSQLLETGSDSQVKSFKLTLPSTKSGDAPWFDVVSLGKAKLNRNQGTDQLVLSLQDPEDWDRYLLLSFDPTDEGDPANKESAKMSVPLH